MRKNARKTTEISCHKCGNIFTKEDKEIRRQHKKGQLNFYCPSCSSRSDFKTDKFSPFRKFLRAAQRRYIKKSLEVTVTVEDLAEIWETQNGICPYTGYKMELGKNYRTKMNSPKQASLDRIDSEKGYIKGNVEFVCLSVNYAKNGFTRQQMMDFFKR